MKKHLTTPLDASALAALRTGDIFYLTGTIVTGRDDVHRRVAEEGMDCPVSLAGLAVYHAGPIVRETQDQTTVLAAGPTSSIRMEAYAPTFLEKTGVRLMIGKGGMGSDTAKACNRLGAVHCVYPGGCAVSAAMQVQAVQGAYWRELGMPECLWVLRVCEFGPLIVSIDATGNNMFANGKALYSARRAECEGPVLDAVKSLMHE